MALVLSIKYETEQKENEVKINELQAELDNEQNRAVTSDMFLSSVRKYTRARKLTPRMLNELIDKIEVYQAEKIDGKKVQRLKIHYNCIGAIEIPDLSKLPENNVSVHTRQGVNVQYAALAVWTQKKNVLIGSSPIRTLGMVAETRNS